MNIYQFSNLSARFREETKLLQSYAKWAHWRNTKTHPVVEGRVNNVYGDSFVLQIVIGAHFPHEKPHLYVTRPVWLPKYNHDGYVNDVGRTHQFHTEGASPNGVVEICHTSFWDPSKTLLGVLIRGVIWINAYGRYSRTGKNLCDCMDYDELENTIFDGSFERICKPLDDILKKFYK